MVDDWLDRAAARRAFERATAEDALAREVGQRLIERLQYIKLEPQRILDAACGGATARAQLRERYPAAQIYAFDWSPAALRRSAAQRSLIDRARGLFKSAREHALAADAAALPFADQSFDLVWSNLGLAWAADPQQWLREWHRVLKVDGLLMFTTYGPDTLKTLREAFAAADQVPHVHPFLDMHDLGDALVGCRFADPVMDMEMLTLTYGSATALVDELHAIGYRNAHRERRRGLTGRKKWTDVMRYLEARRSAGRIAVDFEVVYGHAWKAAPREMADGRQIIHFDPHAVPRTRAR